MGIRASCAIAVVHKAIKLRTDAKLTLSTADGLIKSIEKDPDWDWANNEKNRGKLDNLFKEVHRALSTWHAKFLNEDPKLVMKRSAPEIVLAECKTFIALKSLHEDLKDEVDTLNARCNVQPKKVRKVNTKKK